MRNPNLRELRRLSGLTTREVSQLSRQIAIETSIPSYALSCGWLARLENHQTVPNVYNHTSLSVIYGVPIRQLLPCYGINASALSSKQLSIRTPRTMPLQDQELSHTKPPLFAPFANRPQKTTLMPVPACAPGRFSSLHSECGHSRVTYGRIGADDFTLYPLVLPGSIVQIARDCKSPERALWWHEIERPIYFFELRDGYAYGWCELKDGILTVVSHPLSSCQARCFAYPADIQITGRIVALTMFLSPPQPQLPRTQELRSYSR